MKKAFTLIELLMVIALIAIVSTLAVSKLGGVREVSARKVSLANQKAVERAVEAYLVNGGRLNRLDSRRRPAHRRHGGRLRLHRHLNGGVPQRTLPRAERRRVRTHRAEQRHHARPSKDSLPLHAQPRAGRGPEHASWPQARNGGDSIRGRGADGVSGHALQQGPRLRRRHRSKRL